MEKDLAERETSHRVRTSRVPQLTCIWMSLPGVSGLGNLTGLLPILPVGRDHYDDCFEYDSDGIVAERYKDNLLAIQYCF